MNKKTKASLNMRITSEISKLASHIHSSIEGLRLNSKAARAEMRKEMLFAVRSAAAEAKKNLAASVKFAEMAFNYAAKKESKIAKKNAAARAAVAAQLRASTKASKRSIADAVAGLNRSMLALKSETEKKIKKTNSHVTAYADQMKANAKSVSALMKANVGSLVSKINAARKAAMKQVAMARKAMSTEIYRVTSSVKDMETRLSGEISVVSGEVASNKAFAMRVNRRTGAELRRITKLANDRHSKSTRAR